ncbi:MAG TPA: heme-binding protein [Phenylobacterium sp.]|nr:heme-binding protein [Phenylobacterium sp.]
MTVLTLDQASQIVDAGLARAAELKFRPMTVAVLDAGGHLVAFKRQDRSGILRPEIAQGKAWGALGMGHGGRDLARRAVEAPAFYAAIAATSQGRVIPVGGGVLIRDAEGDIIGAAGASGDHPDNDEACAIHGVTQVGLTPDPGEGPGAPR